MPVPVDPLRYIPNSADDAKWKRDVDRLSRDIAAWKAEVDSRLENLEKRVN